MGGASAVGAMFKVAGTVNDTMQKNAESMKNEIELKRQAQLAQGQAIDAESRGGVIAGQAREKGSQTIAAQRVAFSAGGVDASVGTAADVAGGTRLMSEVDANTIQNNAAREAWGHREVSNNLATQAGLEEGKRAENTFGGVLSSASTVVSAIGGGLGGS